MQKKLLRFILPNAEKTRIWYICSFLLLILALLLSSYVTTKMRHHSVMVMQSDAVVNNLEQTMGYIIDAETSVRGFIIMHDSAYLQPYLKDRQKIDSVQNRLAQTISDTHQLHQLHTLQLLIAHRYEKFLNTMEAFKKNTFETNIESQKRMNEGLRAMDSLKLQVSAMQQYEAERMAGRHHTSGIIYYIITAINIIALIISVLLGLFAFNTFNKENKARTEADHKTADYRKRLEGRLMELRTANLELTALRNNEKFVSTGRIARTIAHEVRNPLTNINLAVEQLEEDTVGMEDADVMIDMIKRNSRRIQQLITDLLSSTRFAELHFEKVSLHLLLDQTLQQAADRIELHHIQVEKRYFEDLEELMVDGEKLKVAFLNIILNAIEAMKPGEGRLVLTTAVEPGFCIIKIADNGSGMSKETLQRLFEPYFTQKEKGNGLGLTNTQNIILNHKGLLNVESEPGAGTTFIIRLPYGSA